MAKGKKKANVNISSNKRKESFTGKTASVVGSIYTYATRKKPKRLGKNCVHFNVQKLTCELSNNFCKDADECNYYLAKEIQQKINTIPRYNKQLKKYSSDLGITAIVVTNNNECIYKNHVLKDIIGILRVVEPTGNIINVKVPMFYCERCMAYYILKNEFYKVKKNGIILCQVLTNQTYEKRVKYETEVVGKESRIHEMGYNVQKNSKYTNQQRQIILANIIENTDISKEEIQSLIRRCISQHKNTSRYSDAIRLWEMDYQFLSTYQKGSIPEVIVSKINDTVS